jgi:SRSO17 transposase
MVAEDSLWLAQLDAFMEHFREDFRRREQWRWASVYLQGLLRPGDRKTIGHLAQRVVVPSDLPVRDTVQALQHFVNQSPWDEDRLWRRYRALLADRFAASTDTLVLEELAFVKQGQHSVGVQRQYSAALGGKHNCQIAVSIHRAGADGVLPLALRLYLPRGWLNDAVRLDAAGVPDEARQPQSRASLAMHLLDELRGDGWPIPLVVGGTVFGADAGFREALAMRGLSYVLEVPDDARLLTGERVTALEEGSILLVSNGGEPSTSWRGREAVRQANRTLRDERGLDHFEGRSWRGFHHHACLAVLAHAFARLQRQPFGPGEGTFLAPRSEGEHI